MDSATAGSFLLPRPAGLSAHADRVWADADQRSAPRSDVKFGNGPDFTDAAGRSAGDFRGRRGAAGKNEFGTLDGSACSQSARIKFSGYVATGNGARCIVF